MIAGSLQHGDSFMVHNERWTAWRDERTERMYYNNTKTGATQWADPRPEVRPCDGQCKQHFLWARRQWWLPDGHNAARP